MSDWNIPTANWYPRGVRRLLPPWEPPRICKRLGKRRRQAARRAAQTTGTPQGITEVVRAE